VSEQNKLHLVTYFRITVTEETRRWFALIYEVHETSLRWAPVTGYACVLVCYKQKSRLASEKL
jgi:hypothetical protein